jgi:hypothetical protein
VTFRLADMVDPGGDARVIVDAFRNLLGAERFFAVAPDRQLPALPATWKTRSGSSGACSRRSPVRRFAGGALGGAGERMARECEKRSRHTEQTYSSVVRMQATTNLADEIAELAARLDSATQRLLTCIRAFDESGDWERQGAVSCAHWLSWRVGLDLVTAREKVRVARALGMLPRVDQALERGEISYAKVRAITRVATPANEETLLQYARHATGAQLDRICRLYRQVAANLCDPGAPAEDRAVRERVLPGGMVKLELILTPDEAAVVLKAIDRAQATLESEQQPGAPAEACRDDRQAAQRARVTTRASRADALVFIAESHLHQPATDSSVNNTTRHELLIHLDQDVLAPDGQWVATLDDGTRISTEALRRVACDAALVPTLTDPAGTTLDVGRRTRAIPPALRRALWVRDRGCRFPGCTHTRFLHGHHIQHWLHGGRTALDNLVLLCSRHHGLVHEGGFRIRVAEDGALSFEAPGRKPLIAVPAPPAVDDALESMRIWERERGLQIDADTNLPWWDGAVPDYDLAVTGLLGAD